ncbi:MAG: hypothetical protein AVDCRST_MAG20-1983, partial [uncultured Acidimicrobiales bacterium]
AARPGASIGARAAWAGGRRHRADRGGRPPRGGGRAAGACRRVARAEVGVEPALAGGGHAAGDARRPRRAGARPVPRRRACGRTDAPLVRRAMPGTGGAPAVVLVHRRSGVLPSGGGGRGAGGGPVGLPSCL